MNRFVVLAMLISYCAATGYFANFEISGEFPCEDFSDEVCSNKVKIVLKNMTDKLDERRRNGLISWFPKSDVRDSGYEKYLDQLKSYIDFRNELTEQLSATVELPLTLNYKSVSTDNIPKSFDVRDFWPYCKHFTDSIENEGNCFSSHAISVASTLNDRLCIATKGQEDFLYSAEDILTCCKACKAENTCRHNGSQYRTWKFWMDEGIVSGAFGESNEGCLPFFPSKQFNTPISCHKNCTNPNYKTPYEEDKYEGAIFYRLKKNEIQIQTEIMAYGPVTSQLELYPDLLVYSKGVYENQFGNEIGHCVIKIIGWGVEDKLPFWLVANTWGRKWGDLNGFFKILRGDDHLGIETNVMAGRRSSVLAAREELLANSAGKIQSNFFFALLFLFFIYT